MLESSELSPAGQELFGMFSARVIAFVVHFLGETTLDALVMAPA